MVIFSMGGLELQRHLRGGAVRCRTGLMPIAIPPQVTLDPYPGREGKGVVEDGSARLLDADGAEIARRPVGPGAGGFRWDDLVLLAYTAGALWAWLVLPLALDDPAVTVREVDERRREVEWPDGGRPHLLHLDGEGRVVRHDDGDLVHELSGHCDFGGAELATVRRSRRRDGHATVAWADVVAAHVLPSR
jgi:hypothetical protein